ncbi:MAG: TlpA disulfide reductase family protein, partial [Lysinibacillus sp.]
ILTLLVLIVAINFIKTEKTNETELIPATPLQQQNTVNEIQEEEIEVNGEIKYAQDFTLTTLQGEQVSLSDYKGKIVILNFWASWCGPCKEEMPHMQSFYEKHPDVAMLAVNLTSMDLGIDAVKQFVNDFGLTFPILLDEADVVGKQYNIITIPTSYMIDPEGRIFKEVIGPMDERMMEDLVSELKSYN